MSKTKQKSRAAKKTAVFFIVFTIIEMLILGGVAYVFRNDDVTPSIFGYSFFLMDSDKMDSGDNMLFLKMFWLFLRRKLLARTR